MIGMVLRKIGSLSSDHKGSIDKDIVNKMSLKTFLEHFLVACRAIIDIKLIIFKRTKHTI